jgi:hypothetical protein
MLRLLLEDPVNTVVAVASDLVDKGGFWLSSMNRMDSSAASHRMEESSRWGWRDFVEMAEEAN